MLIPSGWWHMAYNPVETLAFSSQFLNPQNYRPALYGVLSGNEAVGDCVVEHGIVHKLDQGVTNWKGGREYTWTRREQSFPYNGTMAQEETEIVLGCLRSKIQPVQIPGKEDLGKTSGLKWLTKDEADQKIAAGEFTRVDMDHVAPTQHSQDATTDDGMKTRRRRKTQPTSEL